jgi:hypothetical protein
MWAATVADAGPCSQHGARWRRSKQRRAAFVTTRPKRDLSLTSGRGDFWRSCSRARGPTIVNRMTGGRPLHVVPGASHWPQYDQPQVLADLLIESREPSCQFDPDVVEAEPRIRTIFDLPPVMDRLGSRSLALGGRGSRKVWRPLNRRQRPWPGRSPREYLHGYSDRDATAQGGN